MDNLYRITGERSVARLELAKAGIPAYDCTRDLEPVVFGTVIGFLYFDSGTYALFRRLWHYWAVDLSSPLPYEQACTLNSTWSRELRVDGHEFGAEPRTSGVAYYHVDTQKGLIALVDALKMAFGCQGQRLSKRSSRLRQPQADELLSLPEARRLLEHNLVIPESLNLLAAPATTKELAAQEIAVLCTLAEEYVMTGSDWRRYFVWPEGCYRRALQVAIDHFGNKSPELRSTRERMASFYHGAAEREREVINRTSPGNSDLWRVYLPLQEQILSRLLGILWDLRRREDAASVLSELVALRSRLEELGAVATAI